MKTPRKLLIYITNSPQIRIREFKTNMKIATTVFIQFYNTMGFKSYTFTLLRKIGQIYIIMLFGFIMGSCWTKSLSYHFINAMLYWSLFYRSKIKKLVP